MASSAPIRMRKVLAAADGAAPPGFPDGVRVVPFLPGLHARPAHALLAAAHTDRGESFDEWWTALRGDAEFDADTVFIAIDAQDCVAGVAICWNVPFVKDVVVAPAWRRRGLGAALMQHAFAWFARRGHPHVDLKVDGGNVDARGLYRRLGMREMPA
ncbi:GNAT family N-acetyltransferase [Pseudoduganella sp. SL102]|uniref:GNAT family N-acetyltransferase n=1 Tax=Pseudoduganella sp. SL102 TaxID=2995154 RepID=UPI00248D0073|nr:GNAT family N-acetyltransferase [Pseudoduganella sp. SL102]WBS05264.1 GNAT family N-acetyltransferase [Pseudoduganella sp. SL102]